MSAWAATRRDYTADICRAFIKLGGCNRRSFSSSPSRWKSCYQILGVSRTATQAEIKRAYIELSKLEHPDRSTRSDAKQRFSNINAAHTVLRSKETREEYDRTLEAEDFKKAQEAKKAAQVAAAAKARKQQQQQEAQAQAAASAKPSAKPTSTPLPNKTSHASSSTNSSPSATRSSSAKQSSAKQFRTTSSGQPRPRHFEDDMLWVSELPSFRRTAPRPPPRAPPPAAFYVEGQPPSPEDRRRHEMIKAYELENVSRLLFPRGNDPCKQMGIWHYRDPWNDDGMEPTPSFMPFPGRSPNDYIPLLVLGYSMMQGEDVKKALAYSRKLTRRPGVLGTLIRSAFFWMFK